MKSNKDFDSLKDKLKKLKALAERGCGGESENARRLLERLCAANGIDLGYSTTKQRKGDTGSMSGVDRSSSLCSRNATAVSRTTKK